MGHNGSGPPDHWAAFTTKGMNGPDDYAQALTNLSALGFTGPEKSVPSPLKGEANITWVAVGGYKEKS